MSGESSYSPLGISVIIANYNAGEKLRDCLASLFAWDYPTYEVILVDDASSDDSVAIAREFPVRIMEMQGNLGSGICRHKGILASKFDTVFVIDADTVMPKDAPYRIDNAIQKEGFDGVIGVVDTALNPGIVQDWTVLEICFLAENSSDDPHQFFICLCGAIKKEVYLENGGMFHRDLDDVEFSGRLSANVRLKTDKELNFSHYYSPFFSSMEKFFRRTYHYIQLPKPPKSAWVTADRKWAILASLLTTLTTVVAGVTTVADLPEFSGPSAAAAIFFLFLFYWFSIPALLFAAKKRGFWFALGSSVVKFFMSLSIAVGGVLGVARSWAKKVWRWFLRRSGPFRIYLQANLPTYIILYITSRCNSYCSYCFQYEILNKPERIKDELTLAEYERLARSMPVLEHLTLGGGEPFLRKDIADIAIVFHQHTGVSNISIPSNGLNPNGLEKQVTKILESCPGLTLKVALSVDGIGKEHDQLRGVAGNYEKLLECDQRLSRLRQRFSNLYYIVNTCYSKKNQESVFNTLEENVKSFSNDIQSLTLVRGCVSDGDESKDVDIFSYNQVVDYIADIQKIQRKKPLAFMERIHQGLQEECRSSIRSQIATGKGKYLCTAGKTMAIVDDIGNVNPCEILSSKFRFNNLRNFGMDLGELLKDDKVKKIINQIRDERCFCTWECAQLNSIVFSITGWKNILSRVFASDTLPVADGSQTALKEYHIDRIQKDKGSKPTIPIHPMTSQGDSSNPFL
ncbi:MAG: glycosyltransferase [Magnetococcales bacterium]|nr:glycosyltransferase [Magnetococcales bacterium]